MLAVPQYVQSLCQEGKGYCAARVHAPGLIDDDARGVPTVTAAVTMTVVALMVVVEYVSG